MVQIYRRDRIDYQSDNFFQMRYYISKQSSNVPFSPLKDYTVERNTREVAALYEEVLREKGA